MSLDYQIEPRPIKEFINYNNNELLNTNPGFQRHSVWKKADRLKLINSILKNNPIPNIFLYENNEDKNQVYDVIDGKQRLQTILKYVDPAYKGISEKIEGKVNLDEDIQEIPTYNSLSNEDKNKFNNYRIGVIYVNGDFQEVLNLFINLNSLGEPLRKQEIRNAKFINNALINFANKFVKGAKFKKWRNYLLKVKSLKSGLHRMALEEFILELLISDERGDLLDGKKIINIVLANKKSKLNPKLEKNLLGTLAWIEQIFGDFSSTRLTHKSDFYTIFFHLNNLYKNGFISNNKNQNKVAAEVVLGLFDRVDKLIDNPKIKTSEDIRTYVDSIQRGTDSLDNRKKRNMVISEILESVFTTKKDQKRLFNDLQKRILWNNIRIDPKCSNKKCNTTLSWADITIDHIKAWSNGGLTQLTNAQILCQKCNSSKGAR